MAISLSEIKKGLEHKDKKELLEYCLRLSRFKKENKEYLAYILFEEDDVTGYIEKVKEQTDLYFGEINMSSVFFIKKSLRKILRLVNKHIRFSLSKQVEAELLIHFCNCFQEYSIPIHKSKQLENLYNNPMKKAEMAIAALHPDLQYDLRKLLK